MCICRKHLHKGCALIKYNLLVHPHHESMNFAWPGFTLWPVLGNSVPKLGHEFLLLWLHFYSFSKNSCFQGSKHCGSCTKFWNFWNWNKIAPTGAKFQAWVLGRESSKPAIVQHFRLFLKISKDLFLSFLITFLIVYSLLPSKRRVWNSSIVGHLQQSL